MKIIFGEDKEKNIEFASKMEDAARCCLKFEGVDGDRTEISVSFVTSAEIKKLNKEFRDVDAVTDVLSFPQFENIAEFPKLGVICLGDVVICIEKAKEQALEFGHSFDREVIYLFVHSMLHLIGYDHMEENDKIEMRKHEEEVMSCLGLTE